MFKCLIRLIGNEYFLSLARLIHITSIIVLLSAPQVICAQGTIVLDKPSSTDEDVIIIASKQIILKPGFHAVGLIDNDDSGRNPSSFIAKIGEADYVSTNVIFAVGSNAMIETPVDPSSAYNYIKTSTFTSLSADYKPNLVTIQYFDGLGRSIQTIETGVTHNGEDLVSLTEYNTSGYEWKRYLPTLSGWNYGRYVKPTTLTAKTESQYNDVRPYTETIYEQSPLYRVIGKQNAGNDWVGHGTSVVYEANGDDIFFFKILSDNKINKVSSNYIVNTLYKTVRTNEDGKSTVEFKDKLGHVVLKRNFINGDNVDTYFVYNDLGQLCYVLPPKASDELATMAITLSMPDVVDSQTDAYSKVLWQLAYHYRYDDRGNCIFKKLPGCEPIYMVYDRSDRLILSQDGNQRLKSPNEWSVTKYDQLGRTIGMWITDKLTKSHAELIDLYSSDLIVEDCTNGVYSNTKFTEAIPLTLNFYDNYNFASINSLNYDNSQEQYGYTALWSNATGLLTGTRVYLLDSSGSYTTTANYYDENEHIVQSRSTNWLGGYDCVYNQYDFTGKVLKTLKKHKIATLAEVSELYCYQYDHGQRLLTTSYSLNGASPIVLTSNTYDELGRVKEKSRHNGKENGSIEYNIQNWPTRIQAGDFVETLHYNKDLPNGTTPCYNGNIAYSTWTYKGETRGYRYNYDGLNRLEWAQYRVNGTEPYSYNESYTYDKMGNILNLERLGEDQTIDYLNYTYNGNQVTSIMDDFTSQNMYSVKEYQDKAGYSQNEMSYDANGNMVKDLDRDIVSIRYNVLNLPDVIQFKNGNQIKNLYDASGKKLGTEYFTQLTNIAPLADGQIVNQHYISGAVDQYGTAYIGNFEYKTLKGLPSLTTLTRIYNDEGYVENLTNPQYFYYRRDHLGDDREVWLANTNTVVQHTQYYPSGLPWAYQAGDNPDLQHRKYNGKEFVEMHGYDTYDIVWRQYYPAIMRFQTPDPEVENDYDLSPYTMCDNNMVIKTDPDGRVAIVDNLVGAGIGALAEYGGQVTANLIEGRGIRSFVDNIDLADIAISAGEGFVTSGGSTLVKAVATVGSELARNAFDFKSNGKGNVNNWNSVKKNTVLGLTLGKTGEALPALKKMNILKAPTPQIVLKQARRDAKAAGQIINKEKRIKIQNKAEAKTISAKKVNEAISKTPQNVVAGGGTEVVKRKTE